MNYTKEDAIKSAQNCGYKIIRMKKTGEVFARQLMPSGKVSVKAWRAGKSAKPSFYYLFKNEANAEKHCREWLESQKKWQTIKDTERAEKQAKRATLKASDHWAVGDVAYTSWGYDQTNVEYFQVVRLLPKSVIVRQVAVNSSDFGGPTGGKIAPRRYEFIGPEQVCPLHDCGSFLAGPCFTKDRPSFKHHVTKWCGKAVYCSSYA